MRSSRVCLSLLVTQCCVVLVIVIHSFGAWQQIALEFLDLATSGRTPSQRHELRCMWNDWNLLHNTSRTRNKTTRTGYLEIRSRILKQRYNISAPIWVRSLKSRRVFLYKDKHAVQPFALVKLACRLLVRNQPEYAEILASAISTQLFNYSEPEAHGILIRDIDSDLANPGFFRTCFSKCLWTLRDGATEAITGVIIPFRPGAELLQDQLTFRSCQIQQRFQTSTMVQWLLDNLLSNNDRTCRLNAFYDGTRDEQLLLDFDSMHVKPWFCKANEFPLVQHPAFMNPSSHLSPYPERPFITKENASTFYCTIMANGRKTLDAIRRKDIARILFKYLQGDERLADFLSEYSRRNQCLDYTDWTHQHDCIVEDDLYQGLVAENCLAKECSGISLSHPHLITLCHVAYLFQARVLGLYRATDLAYMNVCAKLR